MSSFMVPEGAGMMMPSPEQKADARNVMAMQFTIASFGGNSCTDDELITRADKVRDWLTPKPTNQPVPAFRSPRRDDLSAP